MSFEYDKYYQTENLFGEPYPELIKFYSLFKTKGKLLDVGCGQGRDSIALARLGYEVTGIDYSKVGIEQLNEIAKKERLTLEGGVGDIYEYSNFKEFDFILLDSMFHFGKKERAKEIQLLERILRTAKQNSYIIICIQNSINKLKVLNSIISDFPNQEVINKERLVYKFEDKQSNHKSTTEYEMVTIKKI